METTSRIIIETPRLRLISCDEEILEALFKGDEFLAAHLHIGIPAKWTEFGEPVFRWTYDKISQNRAMKGWFSYLPVLKEENMLAGSCGYKGGPEDGRVEIGYEVAQSFRGKGLATEIAGSLIKFAFQHDEVKRVQAHTLPEENESVSVLKKCGMKKMEEIIDPDDGKVWRWEIQKGGT